MECFTAGCIASEGQVHLRTEAMEGIAEKGGDYRLLTDSDLNESLRCHARLLELVIT